MHIPESQNQKDARVENLWRHLDPKEVGEIDVKGLQAGLKRLNHPLGGANELLHEVLRAVDSNGDGKIQYEEFRVFVEETEGQLWTLFNKIDRDGNGRIDKNELKAAFQRANLSVPPKKLDRFVEEFDRDGSGVITFDEWRDFLLFLPADTPGLKAVLHYYSSAITLNAEGDALLNDGNSASLGTTPTFISSLLGSILRIAAPPKQPKHSYQDDTLRDQRQPYLHDPSEDTPSLPKPHTQYHQLPSSPHAEMGSTSSTPNKSSDSSSGVKTRKVKFHFLHNPLPSQFRHFEPDFNDNIDCAFWTMMTDSQRSELTAFLPNPGYFIAGGVAGVISRTATAPLDRLKVYLIANTGTSTTNFAAVKGSPLKAVRGFGRPLIDACKVLWSTGGVRSLFAGNGINVIKVMPESAIKFGSYEAAKRMMARLEGHDDPQTIAGSSKFVAGGLGGMFSQLCIYPLDTLKFRMQCSVEANGLRGNQLIKHALKQMAREGFIRSSYRGLTMGLMGMFPYSAIDLGTFELCKTTFISYQAKKQGLPEDHPEVRPGNLACGAMGAFSGAFGASLVYPLNLLRTRLQAQGTVLHPQTYTGAVDCAKQCIAKEGVRGLFKGLAPNLLKVAPAVSITYMCYEHTKRVLDLP